MRLTVYFDDPFWVALAGRQDGDQLRAVRHVFGAEPNDPELLFFVLHALFPLLDHVTVAVTAPPAPRAKRNPKRAARAAAKLLAARGGSTKAHAAVRLHVEANAVARRTETKAAREAAAEHKRRIARAKAKQRHQGH